MANSDDQKAEMDAPLPIFKRPKDDKEDHVSNQKSSELPISELQAPKSTNDDSEKVDLLFLSLCLYTVHIQSLTLSVHCNVPIPSTTRTEIF